MNPRDKYILWLNSPVVDEETKRNYGKLRGSGQY